jgi:hypothetical protein
MFGPKKEGTTEDWRQLRNVEIGNLPSSPNIMWTTKSRRIKWMGHKAGMGENKYTYRSLVGEH